MGKITTVQTNFNAGELSPDLAGHIDLDRYQNGLKTMLNTVPQVAGGGFRRAGSRIIAPTKTIGTTRLIPFVFNKAQAYVLELGDSYVRFFTQSGQITQSGSPIEVATPWPAGEVFAVEFAQRSDTMFIAHPSTPIKRLVRILQTAWTIGDAPFDPGPIDEIGARINGPLTLSVGTAGSTANVFSPAGGLLASDVGRNIVAGAGQAQITGVASSTNGTALVTASFDSLAYLVNEWKLDQSPRVAITPSASGPANGVITLVADGPPLSVQSVSLTGTTMTVTMQSPHGLTVGDPVVLSGFESAGLDGLYTVTGVTSSVNITFTFNGSLLSGGTLGTVYHYGIGMAWRAQDVGSYVDINGGLVQINGWDGAGIKAFGIIIRALTATVTAPADSWSLKSAVWNPVDGYPRAVSIYQQRLYAAGSDSFPDRFWASGTGLYYDFTPGTNDGDAFSYAAASDQVNEVAHLASSKILAVFTEGEEFTITGGNGAAVAPTNIAVTSQSVFGSAPVRPLRVANELIYAQRAGKKIRSMAYDFNTDSFRSQNLTRLAAHITGTGIVDMAFQAEPNPVVWMVRADGVLVSMTYDRDDNVCGFARHTTDGLYKSVCVIPGTDGDVIFAVVQRTINGQTVQYVEQFDPSIMTDAAIIGANSTPATIWTGLGSLEGKTCDVKADGVYMGQMTVTGGQITLPRGATSIEVGLHYDSQMVLLTPNISLFGTSQGNQQRTGTVILRLLNTIRCVVDGQPIPFREFGQGILDQAPQPYTGDKDVSDFGWDDKAEITIMQDQPYQWQVLALIRQFTVNNG